MRPNVLLPNHYLGWCRAGLRWLLLLLTTACASFAQDPYISPAAPVLNPGQGATFTLNDPSGVLSTAGGVSWTYAWTASSGTISSGAPPFLPQNSTATYSAPASPIVATISCVTVSSAGTRYTWTTTAIADTQPTASGVNVPLTVTGANATVSEAASWWNGTSGLSYAWSCTDRSGNPLNVSFAPNFSNAAQTAVAAFTQAGPCTIAVTVTDPYGKSSSASTNITVAQTLTSMALNANDHYVQAGATIAMVAMGLDQFGNAMSLPASDFTGWTAGGGAMSASGLYTAGSVNGTYPISVGNSINGVTYSGSVVIGSNAPPTITSLTAAANPVMTTGTTLSVVANDPAGVANLTYQWACTSQPVATFSSNGSNAASSTYASFPYVGPFGNTFTIQVTATDARGLFCQSNPIAITVLPSPSSLILAPASGVVNPGGTLALTVSAVDQYGKGFIPTNLTWISNPAGLGSVGAITPAQGAGSATLTAGATSGPYSLTASGGSAISNAISVRVNAPPNVTGGPTASLITSGTQGQMPGTTVQLAVTASDDGGSDMSYAWSQTSGPSTATFSVNRTPSAASTIATIASAGTYVFAVQISDSLGLSISSTVSIIVPQLPTGLAINPYNIVLVPMGTQALSIAASDQFNHPMPSPTVSWTVTPSGPSISSTNVVTATGTPGTYQLVAHSGSYSTSATLRIDAPPLITVQPTATVLPGGASAQLRVTATDDGGPSNLTYTWSPVGSGVVGIIGADGTNATSTTTATFSQAGIYLFQVLIMDAQGEATLSNTVAVTVPALPASLTASPATASVNQGSIQAYTVAGIDQFGHAMTPTGVSWTVSPSTGGTVSSANVFSASGPNGTCALTASVGSVSAAPVQVHIHAPPSFSAAPTASMAAAGTSATLSATAQSADGTAMIYQWRQISGPTGPAFAPNGTAASSTTMATFTQLGTYQFAVTATDALGASGGSAAVTVVVSPVITTLAATPTTATVNQGATQAYAIAATDQFGHALSVSGLAWTVSPSAGGSFTGNVFTASGPNGNYILTASAGSVNAPAVQVHIHAPPTCSPPPSAVLAANGLSATLSDSASSADGTALSYQWTEVSGPSGPTFTPNGSATASSTTVAFTQLGSYQFTVKATDALGLSATSASVTVALSAVATTLAVSPTTTTVNQGSTQAFTLAATDQFGHAMAAPTASWSVSPSTGGSFAVNVFTATGPNGNYSITASAGSVSAPAAQLHIHGPPTFSTPPSASLAAAGTSATLSATATSADGLALTYAWTQTAGAASALSSAKSSTAGVLFSQVGAYTYQLTVTDAKGLSVKGSASATVPAQLTAIACAPDTAMVKVGHSATFTASGSDQFGHALASQPAFSWSVIGAGTITNAGVYTAGASATEEAVVANSGSVSGEASVDVIAGPNVQTPAAVSPSPVTATTATLSVLGSDPAGEDTLTYTWAATALPSGGSAAFQANGTNAAKHTTATFTRAGSYTLSVTITDGDGAKATSQVIAPVSAVPTSIAVSAAQPTVALGATDQCTATLNDQFLQPISPVPVFAWTVQNLSGGTVSSTGLFTGGAANANAVVCATLGAITGSTAITVGSDVPTVSIAAHLYQNPVTGLAASLYVLGADPAGASTLTYSWTITGPVSSGPTAPTNAGQTYVASFIQAGAYTATATISNQLGKQVTSSVAFTVAATPTQVVVSPATVTLDYQGTQQFSAIVLDQFGHQIPNPSFNWWISGDGAVSTTGLYVCGWGPNPTTRVYATYQQNPNVWSSATVTETGHFDNITFQASYRSGLPFNVWAIAPDGTIMDMNTQTGGNFTADGAGWDLYFGDNVGLQATLAAWGYPNYGPAPHGLYQYWATAQPYSDYPYASTCSMDVYNQSLAGNDPYNTSGLNTYVSQSVTLNPGEASPVQTFYWAGLGATYSPTFPPAYTSPGAASNLAPMRAATSADPIHYGNGEVVLDERDLVSEGFVPFQHGRCYSNIRTGGVANGLGWSIDELPSLSLPDATHATISFGSLGAYAFAASSNGGWTPVLGNATTLRTYAATPPYFVFVDTMGRQYCFYSYDLSLPAAQRGQLYAYYDMGGDVVNVLFDANGHPSDYQMTIPSGSQPTREDFVFTNTSAGVITNVAQQVTVNGVSSIVRQVAYEYYTGAAGDFGIAGTLKRVTVLDGANPPNPLGQSYYRYYLPGQAFGFPNALRFALEPRNYARMSGAGIDPTTAPDSVLAQYADKYFEYDQDSLRVTRQTVQGDSVDGCGTFSYGYLNSNNSASDPNSWTTRTTETLPDGNCNLIYCNAAGLPIAEVRQDITTGKQWITGHRYDASWRETYIFKPSAVISISETLTDLFGWNGTANSFSGIKSNAGEILSTTYGPVGSESAATATAPGYATGYIAAQAVQQGWGGSPIATLSYTYFQHTDTFGNATFPIAACTRYGGSTGSDLQTTSYSYAWASSAEEAVTSQASEVYTTDPVIPSSEHGSGSADSTIDAYDNFGRHTWRQDEVGTIYYTGYDILSGGVITEIRDVNTNLIADFTAKPADIATKPGHGLHLKTTNIVDLLGRSTCTTDPAGKVIRRVYNDPDFSMRVYPGWRSGVGPTGPTQLAREDRVNGYFETLTMSATPAMNAAGAPLGTEAISSVDTLLRTCFDLCGRVSLTDRYLSLSGITYARTTLIGTVGTTVAESSVDYDARGREYRLEDAGGTISYHLYDALGRAVAAWQGTNDTPASGSWSPTNNGGTSNMVPIASSVYDNGGIGDGNLTSQTVSASGAAADQRTTQYAYDWRDRLVATKAGVQGSESSTVHRPITYDDLDNLGRVIASSRFDGDGVAIAGATFAPLRPSASLLRAYQTIAYDERGRIYQRQSIDVSQSTGLQSTTPAITNLWYDARGDVIRSVAPSGEATTMVYDGAGRRTTIYTSDTAGGTSWAAADTVTGDNVFRRVASTLDADGNQTVVTVAERFHDETATGDLGSPTQPPCARVSSTAAWYDAANRLIARDDFGTNGGAPITYAATPTPASDTVLQTAYAYNPSGWIATVTDPRGVVTLTKYDNAGRTTATVEAYNAAINAGNPSGASNRTTTVTYDVMDHVLARSALGADGEPTQVTAYAYGPTTGSGSANNNELASIAYPDPTTGVAGAPSETYTYNAVGQPTSRRDANGTTHAYTYDVLGRMTSDAAITIGAGVDGAVQSHTIAYDDSLSPATLSTCADLLGMTVLSQVQRIHDGYGDITQEAQSANGPVTGTTPTVKRAFNDPTGLQASLTYASGRQLSYARDAVSRIASVSDAVGPVTLESYAFLGYDTPVIQSHPEIGVDLSMVAQTGEADGPAGDPYNGLDRFGRVVDQRYIGGLAADRWQYAYDRGSHRLYQDDLGFPNASELYQMSGCLAANAYDQLGRLTSFERGPLSASGANGSQLDSCAPTDADASGVLQKSLSWWLDQQGGWREYTTPQGVIAEDTNAQNEVRDDEYDQQGNRTLGYANPIPTLSGTMVQGDLTVTYDAWDQAVRAARVTTANGEPGVHLRL